MTYNFSTEIFANDIVKQTKFDNLIAYLNRCSAKDVSLSLFHVVMNTDSTAIIFLNQECPIFMEHAELFEMLRDLFNDRIHYYIYSNWYKHGGDLYDFLKQYADSITLTTNTIEEYVFYRARGYGAVYFNQNSWLDASIYQIHNVKKEYDIVYNATPKPYKNHKLLKNIISNYKSLFIAYDPYHLYQDGEGVVDLGEYKPTTCIVKNITIDTVVSELNKCKIGLCLSVTEGANFASSEYLLCGLPVISVRGRGGRDIWYNKNNSIIIDDDASQLKQAIDYILNNYENYNSEQIRNTHIKQQQDHIVLFVEHLQQLLASIGIQTNKETSLNLIYDVYKLCIRRRYDMAISLNKQELP